MDGQGCKKTVNWGPAAFLLNTRPTPQPPHTNILFCLFMSHPLPFFSLLSSSRGARSDDRMVLSVHRAGRSRGGRDRYFSGDSKKEAGISCHNHPGSLCPT